MDIASLTAVDDDGAVLHLRHPVTGAPLFDGDKPVTITLAGKDSQRYRTAQRVNANRYIRQGRKITPTVESFEADMTEVLAACTVAWTCIDLDGDAVPATKEGARKVYTDPRCAWMREQVDAFIDDRANFSKASATT